MSKTKKRLLTWPRLIIVGLVLFLCLMGLWFFLRDTLVKGLVQGIQTLESEGYQIGHGGLNVSGFPLSLTAHSQTISIKAPSGDPQDLSKNWAIKADQVDIKTKTLYPLAWSVEHSGNMRIDMRGPRGERYMFDIMPANIDAQITASIKGHLKSARLDIGRTQLDALIGTPPILSKMQGLKARIEIEGNIGEFSLDVNNLLLSPKLPGAVEGVLGRKVSRLAIHGNLDNWSTLEREGVEVWSKKGGHLKATDWQVLWGSADMIGDFDFVFKNGLPEGILHIRMKKADELVDKITRARPEEGIDSQKIKGFLSLIKPDADGRQSVELTVRDGVLRYGFIPLANLKN